MSDARKDEGGAAAQAPLQFDKAEFAGGPQAQAAGAQPCAMCAAPITGTYFEVAGRVVCPSCRDKVVTQLEGGSKGARFAKAAIFGAGAALLGAIGWYLIIKITDMNLGLVSIAVGWLVGRAVAKGCGGRGGLPYQALAVFLSYCAIAGAFLPLAIGAAMDQRQSTASQTTTSVTTPAAAGDTTTPTTDAPAMKETPPATTPPDGEPKGGLIGALVAMVGITLSLPFLIGSSSPLSGLIFCFALWEAWKLNRRAVLAIAGPFQRAGVAPPAAPLTP